jgi:hypothetical protein
MEEKRAPIQKLTWSAPEYEEKERSNDWFWALGVIVVTGSTASIIFGNYFFAVLLILSGLLLGFFAVKKPDMIAYELGPEGLRAKNRLYPYESIKAFWVQADFSPAPVLKPMLFIHSERAFLPIISLPIPLQMAQKIHEVFSAHEIAEVEMEEHISDKIMEALGF